MTLYRVTTAAGASQIIDADRRSRVEATALRLMAGSPEPGALTVEPLDADALTGAAIDAIGAICESLGEGVSFTCDEYARVRSLAAIVAPDQLAELDGRHASTDDDESDCMHAAYVAGLETGYGPGPRPQLATSPACQLRERSRSTDTDQGATP